MVKHCIKLPRKGCGVSILGNVQNLAEHNPKQASVADFSLSSGEVGVDDLCRPLPPSSILRFSDFRTESLGGLSIYFMK